MNVFFHSQARKELELAVDFYEGCSPGLGYEFLEEIYATIGRIIQYPEGWSRYSARTRRCLTQRFPYGIIYHHAGDDIQILAVAHSHQPPGYWEKRLTGEEEPSPP